MERDLIVGFDSALSYWRAARVAASGLGGEPEGRVFGARPLSTSERARYALNACLANGPLDVVVSSASERHHCASVRDHVWSGPLRPNMTISLGSGVRVCRIPAMMVQLGRELDEVELARIAHEVSGTYVVTPWADEAGRSGVPAAVSLAELVAYAQAARSMGVPGAARLLRALAVTGENSNSPRETDVSIALRLSRSKGGFGIRDFCMNPTVALSDAGREIVGRQTLRPDFVFPNMTAFEYDSDQEHLSAWQHDYDGRRRDALQASGYDVITLTNGIVKDPGALTALFEGLARSLGIRRGPLTASMVARREELVERIFGRGSRYWASVYLE